MIQQLRGYFSHDKLFPQWTCHSQNVQSNPRLHWSRKFAPFLNRFTKLKPIKIWWPAFFPRFRHAQFNWFFCCEFSLILIGIIRYHPFFWSIVEITSLLVLRPSVEKHSKDKFWYADWIFILINGVPKFVCFLIGKQNLRKERVLLSHAALRQCERWTKLDDL